MFHGSWKVWACVCRVLDSVLKTSNMIFLLFTTSFINSYNLPNFLQRSVTTANHTHTQRERDVCVCDNNINRHPAHLFNNLDFRLKYSCNPRKQWYEQIYQWSPPVGIRRSISHNIKIWFQPRREKIWTHLGGIRLTSFKLIFHWILKASDKCVFSYSSSVGGMGARSFHFYLLSHSFAFNEHYSPRLVHDLLSPWIYHVSY